jgi:hypothetical protein
MTCGGLLRKSSGAGMSVKDEIVAYLENDPQRWFSRREVGLGVGVVLTRAMRLLEELEQDEVVEVMELTRGLDRRRYRILSNWRNG